MATVKDKMYESLVGQYFKYGSIYYAVTQTAFDDRVYCIVINTEVGPESDGDAIEVGEVDIEDLVDAEEIVKEEFIKAMDDCVTNVKSLING